MELIKINQQFIAGKQNETIKELRLITGMNKDLTLDVIAQVMHEINDFKLTMITQCSIIANHPNHGFLISLYPGKVG